MIYLEITSKDLMGLRVQYGPDLPFIPLDSEHYLSVLNIRAKILFVVKLFGAT